MSGNPLAEEKDYRLHVLKAVPKLHVLDKHKVEEGKTTLELLVATAAVAPAQELRHCLLVASTRLVSPPKAVLVRPFILPPPHTQPLFLSFIAVRTQRSCVSHAQVTVEELAASRRLRALDTAINLLAAGGGEGGGKGGGCLDPTVQAATAGGTASGGGGDTAAAGTLAAGTQGGGAPDFSTVTRLEDDDGGGGKHEFVTVAADTADAGSGGGAGALPLLQSSSSSSSAAASKTTTSLVPVLERVLGEMREVVRTKRILLKPSFFDLDRRGEGERLRYNTQRRRRRRQQQQQQQQQQQTLHTSHFKRQHSTRLTSHFTQGSTLILKSIFCECASPRHLLVSTPAMTLTAKHQQCVRVVCAVCAFVRAHVLHGSLIEGVLRDDAVIELLHMYGLWPTKMALDAIAASGASESMARDRHIRDSGQTAGPFLGTFSLFWMREASERAEAHARMATKRHRSQRQRVFILAPLRLCLSAFPV